ncbi:hypothetical protein GCM10027595_18130 [Corynebacterium nasicanis]
MEAYFRAQRIRWLTAIPIPELLFVAAGVVRAVLDLPESSFPSRALWLSTVIGMSALVFALILYVLPRAQVWVAMLFILVGGTVAGFFFLLVDGPIIFGALFPFAGLAAYLAGASHLLRSGLASLAIGDYRGLRPKSPRAWSRSQ